MTIQTPAEPANTTDTVKNHNICGVLVAAHVNSCAAVQQKLSAIAGVEVHEILPDGRMIITVEDSDGLFAPDTVVEISRIKGVLSASLVYHHFEPLSSLEETSHEVQ